MPQGRTCRNASYDGSRCGSFLDAVIRANVKGCYGRRECDRSGRSSTSPEERAPLRSLVLMTSEFWLVAGEAKRISSANPTRLSCLQYRFRLTKRSLSALWRLERQQSSKSERHRSGAARVLQLRKTASCRAKYSGGLDQMLSATSITILIPTASTASTMAS
jgi:hypothetical protein